MKVDVDAGKHDIVVKPPGRPQQTQHVELTAGQEKAVTFTVPPPLRTAPVRPTQPKQQPVHPTQNADELLKPSHSH